MKRKLTAAGQQPRMCLGVSPGIQMTKFARAFWMISEITMRKKKNEVSWVCLYMGVFVHVMQSRSD